MVHVDLPECEECGCCPDLEEGCWFCNDSIYQKLHKKYVCYLNGKSDDTDFYDREITDGFVRWVESPAGLWERRKEYFAREVRLWACRKRFDILALQINRIDILSAHDKASVIGDVLGLGETTPYGVTMKLGGLS